MCEIKRKREKIAKLKIAIDTLIHTRTHTSIACIYNNSNGKYLPLLAKKKEKKLQNIFTLLGGKRRSSFFVAQNHAWALLSTDEAVLRVFEKISLK